jgi:hypothetical protein
VVHHRAEGRDGEGRDVRRVRACLELGMLGSGHDRPAGARARLLAPMRAVSVSGVPGQFDVAASDSHIQAPRPNDVGQADAAASPGKSMISS